MSQDFCRLTPLPCCMQLRNQLQSARSPQITARTLLLGLHGNLRVNLLHSRTAGETDSNCVRGLWNRLVQRMWPDIIELVWGCAIVKYNTWKALTAGRTDRLVDLQFALSSTFLPGGIWFFQFHSFQFQPRRWPFLLWPSLWPLTLTHEHDLDRGTVNHQARFDGHHANTYWYTHTVDRLQHLDHEVVSN